MVKLFEMIAWLQYVREAGVDVVGKMCFYFTFGIKTKITSYAFSNFPLWDVAFLSSLILKMSLL